MKNSQKYIGINQRIPFEVFDATLSAYLKTSTINEVAILQHMKEYTKGENRAYKASRYLVNIITRNKQLLDLYKNSTKEPFNISLSDKKVLILCLICLTYPIAFDLIQLLAKGFKVQQTLNTQYIVLKISAIYGSNRTVKIAIEALIPMLIELGVIKREKMGLYSLDSKLRVTTTLLNELVVYTDIKSSESKSILSEEIAFRPWYSYFEIQNVNPVSFSKLVKFKESLVGKGYLSIIG